MDAKTDEARHGVGVMRLLVLGGTRFVGRAVVRAALKRGWEVTTFNRGSSAADVPGVETLRGDRRNPDDLKALMSSGPWRAVVDTSGYVPRETLRVCEYLENLVDQYVFMSTVSVYMDWPVKPLSEKSAVLYCPPDADEWYGNDTEDGPTRYGYQKSGCELAVTQTFGDKRSSLLRPAVILGPREYVGRLPWWLNRVATGGQILAPGSPNRSIQPIDVRDVAEFALLVSEHGIGGTWNLAAPVGKETFGEMLSACQRVTMSTAQFKWVPDELLLAHGVRQWSELPLWRTFPGVWQVSSSAALAEGLSCRALEATVADTWDWMQQTGWRPADERADEIGISRDRELEVLANLSNPS